MTFTHLKHFNICFFQDFKTELNSKTLSKKTKMCPKTPPLAGNTHALMSFPPKMASLPVCLGLSLVKSKRSRLWLGRGGARGAAAESPVILRETWKWLIGSVTWNAQYSRPWKSLKLLFMQILKTCCRCDEYHMRRDQVVSFSEWRKNFRFRNYSSILKHGEKVFLTWKL